MGNRATKLHEVDVLRPVIRPYPWGSRTGIASLQGRPVPSDSPEAELWMGAHPSSPSLVTRGGVTEELDAAIAADPSRELGDAAARRFGGRLPFLLKVLSADQALSIQVHPSAAQARSGYAAERSLPRDDPHRNYVDDWPKPELLCALTPFEVLAGLRTPADAAAFAAAIGVPRFATVIGNVIGTDMGQALRAILEWPAGDLPTLIDDVVAGYTRLAAGGGPFAATAKALVKVATDHPGDVGIVAAALLRYAVLQPGEAVFMPAGGLHAYLSGTGIELLANSDNVVRAGLTGKHIDIPELLALLDPAVAVPVLHARPVSPGVVTFDTPAPEFTLFVADLGVSSVRLPGNGPRIVLCADGTATLRSADSVKLARGESCFVSAADRDVTAEGPARLFVAAPGDFHNEARLLVSAVIRIGVAAWFG